MFLVNHEFLVTLITLPDVFEDHSAQLIDHSVGNTAHHSATHQVVHMQVNVVSVDIQVDVSHLDPTIAGLLQSAVGSDLDLCDVHIEVPFAVERDECDLGANYEERIIMIIYLS